VILVVLRALMPVVLDGAFPVDESREKVLNDSLAVAGCLAGGEQWCRAATGAAVV
jgi:hypothetical protein